jgi:hypothetical protein
MRPIIFEQRRTKGTVDKKARRPSSGIRSRLKNGVVRHCAFQRVGIAQNTGRFSGAQGGGAATWAGRLPARRARRRLVSIYRWELGHDPETSGGLGPLAHWCMFCTRAVHFAAGRHMEPCVVPLRKVGWHSYRPDGTDPVGRLIYDARGGMFIEIMRKERPRSTAAIPPQATSEEAKSAFDG